MEGEGMLVKGDKVVMENCGEAKHYEGIVWTCRSGESELCGSPVVWLEDFSGGFASKYLRKVNGDEATVTCVECEKTILHDSNGYYFDGLTGRYSCNECNEKERQRQKVQHEVNSIEITHTVIKDTDVEKYLDEHDQDNFEDCVGQIQINRAMEGRGNPKYIVINTDEDPKFIEEIIKVMKRFRKWG